MQPLNNCQHSLIFPGAVDETDDDAAALLGFIFG
jgi:hypothetical protein